MSYQDRLLVACLTALAIAAACDDSSGPEFPADVEQLRKSVAGYASFEKAQQDGWSTAITDCMEGAQGGMGIHYGNTALIDGTVDELHPEVLMYEPGSNGTLRFVGVEFIVPFSIKPKDGPAPQAFGQAFSPNDTFQVWALHVWTERANPSGLFAAYNPRVSC
jgi:hypothetical protein